MPPPQRPSTSTQSPRLIDIARRVGTSTTSVSRILRGTRLNEYSQETQKRVHKVAEEMGWRPNLIVRGMKTGRTETTGVFIAPYDTFWTGVLFGVHDRLLEERQVPLVLWPKTLVHPTLAPTSGSLDPDESVAHDAAAGVSTGSASLTGTRVDPDGDARRELDRINYLEDRRVDAIITWPLQETAAAERLAMLSARGWRVVTIDAELPEPGRATFVGIDEVDAMRQALKHLRGLKHKRIGLIGLQRQFAWAARRHAAFEAVGGKNAPTLLLDGDSNDCRAFVVKFLRDTPDLTALVCVSDHIARQVIRAAIEAGVDVPGQLSVVGYGNDVYGRDDVPLTTVDQRPYDIGKAAADAALAPELSTSDVLLKASLLVRRSTAAAG